jgi:poly(3-hydroxybutyrate) depolymerase
MLYSLYQAQSDLLAPARQGAALWLRFLDEVPRTLSHPGLRLAAAGADLLATARITHERPAFGITKVQSRNREVEVRETIALATPFCNLVHFEKDMLTPQPRVLIVAPMSGHFATLLRPTVQTMLADFDVYITDWRNARDVPLTEGRFGFDDYVEHLMEFLDQIGPAAHMVAICQPAVPALVATSLLAQAKSRAQPRSLTLIAGPIDTRQSPTKVNVMAKKQTLAEYERRAISTVPRRFAGAGRRVYPGFYQLASFMAMNADRHINAHVAQLRRVFVNDTDGIAAHRKFYEEYFSVADLPAEFYLETVARVFQEHSLPSGALRWRGEKVEPAAIRRTALMAIEGERDDICGVGQTMAALDLCAGIPTAHKTYHLQTGAGHYGVFSGRLWTGSIYPRIRTMIEETS